MNTSLHTRISRKADIRSGSGCDWERGRGLREAGARSRRYTGLLVQERSGANTPTVSYTRGRDLSGGLEGAGGIGGLLARSHGYSGGNWSSHHFYHADGNGNVTALVNSSGTLQASYKYDPYGRLRSQTGPLSNANRLRWSSKPWEGYGPSGLYSYGYRFYEPLTQRWLNRDPMEEEYDINLYRYVYNSPLNYVDPDGFWGIQFGGIKIGWGDPNLAFDRDSWNDLGQGAAATMDGLIPFFDPFKDKYDPCDPIFAWSYASGEIAQNALLTAGGLRAVAWLGGTRFGHGLNHNPYFRIGPGRWGGGMRPRISIGPQRPGKPNPHIPL